MKKITTFLYLLFSISTLFTSQKSHLLNALELTCLLPSKHVPEFILTIGDMMTLPVDCIVNPANSNIQGGGGMDGIITKNLTALAHIILLLAILQE